MSNTHEQQVRPTGRWKARGALALGLCVAAGSVVAVGAPTGAEIVGTSGQVVKIAPPPSVEIDTLESRTVIHAFDEVQDLTLATSVDVDITVPGSYDKNGPFTPGTIPAGTTVSSHFLHSDPDGRPLAIPFEGTVTTDDEIIGVIVVTDTLDATDAVLGAPGTTYPTGTFRGFDPRNQAQDDMLIWMVDNHTVFVHLETAAHADQVRIITRTDPRGGGEGCTPGYWKQAQHFDSWTGYTPGQQFNAVFGVTTFPGKTLLEVLEQGGGGVNALGRHAVAALLNAASGGVSYPFTTGDVITKFQQALSNGTVELTKALLEAENERGCPLN